MRTEEYTFPADCCCEECPGGCCGWWCCPLTGEVMYAFSCADLEAAPCDAEQFCDLCWPDGVNGDPGAPALLHFHFPDYGTFMTVARHSIDEWAHYVDSPNEATPPTLPVVTGVESVTLDLCRENGISNCQFGLVGYGSYTGLWAGTVESCFPFVATFETTLGHVIVSES